MREQERIFKRAKRKKDKSVLEKERARKDPLYKLRDRVGAKLRYAVKTGKVKKPDTCEKCNKKPEAHHIDYRFPLSVKWLCDSHHRLKHC